MYETKPAGEHRMGDGAECARWYAIRTRSASEQLVADGLTARQIEHYLPTRIVMRGGKTAFATMFPGYLFVRTASVTMAPVLAVPGVVQVLGMGIRPEPVADEEIVAIQHFSLLRPAAQILPHLCAGQRVRIRAFDFDGFEGVVARIDGRDVVAVNVEILGRSLAVDVAAEHLEIIRETEPTRTANVVAGLPLRFAHA